MRSYKITPQRTSIAKIIVSAVLRYQGVAAYRRAQKLRGSEWGRRGHVVPHARAHVPPAPWCAPPRHFSREPGAGTSHIPAAAVTRRGGGGRDAKGGGVASGGARRAKKGVSTARGVHHEVESRKRTLQREGVEAGRGKLSGGPACMARKGGVHLGAACRVWPVKR